jgi:hypothetical protein
VPAKKEGLYGRTAEKAFCRALSKPWLPANLGSVIAGMGRLGQGRKFVTTVLKTGLNVER